MTQSNFHHYFPILSLLSFILATNSLSPHSPHPLMHALCGAFFQCCQVLAQSRSSVFPLACRAPSTHPLGQTCRPSQDYPGLSWLCVQGLCSHTHSQLCLCPESSVHLPLQAQIKPQHLTVVFTVQSVGIFLFLSPQSTCCQVYSFSTRVCGIWPWTAEDPDLEGPHAWCTCSALTVLMFLFIF